MCYELATHNLRTLAHLHTYSMSELVLGEHAMHFYDTLMCYEHATYNLRALDHLLDLLLLNEFVFDEYSVHFYDTYMRYELATIVTHLADTFDERDLLGERALHHERQAGARAAGDGALEVLAQRRVTRRHRAEPAAVLGALHACHRT
jgi:hypothetical protein